MPDGARHESQKKSFFGSIILTIFVEPRMAPKRKSTVLDDADKVLSSLPTQVDEFLSKIREHGQELISNAEEEAITIVNEAKQRTDDMNKELTDWEEEKKRIASTHVLASMVTLNVGGKTFTTATATLTRFPDTMLGAMFSGRHALKPDKNGAYCIDRDGRHFHEILNFLRGTTASTESTPKLIEQRLSPEALEEFKVEADFYGLKDLMFPKAIVRIAGATGTNADSINGTYEATNELSGDMPGHRCLFGVLCRSSQTFAPGMSFGSVESVPDRRTRC